MITEFRALDDLAVEETIRGKESREFILCASCREEVLRLLRAHRSPFGRGREPAAPNDP